MLRGKRWFLLIGSHCGTLPMPMVPTAASVIIITIIAIFLFFISFFSLKIFHACCCLFTYNTRDFPLRFQKQKNFSFLQLRCLQNAKMIPLVCACAFLLLRYHKVLSADRGGSLRLYYAYVKQAGEVFRKADFAAFLKNTIKWETQTNIEWSWRKKNPV